jgi:hypothetical protein
LNSDAAVTISFISAHVVKNKRIIQLTKKARHGINIGKKIFQSVTGIVLAVTVLKIIIRAKTAAPIADNKQRAAASLLIERGPGEPSSLFSSRKKLNITSLLLNTQAVVF